MADYIIPDSDKIHSYVTWPESEQIFDDGRGGLGFPEQNNSGCTDGTDASPVSIELKVDIASKTKSEPSVKKSDIAVTVTKSNVDIIPDLFTFAGASFTYDKDSGTGTFTVAEDELPSNYVSYSAGSVAKLIPNTVDSLECTNIVSDEDNVQITGNNGNEVSFRFIGENPTNYIWNNGVSVSIVFHLNLGENDSFYAYLTAQDNPEENGVYQYTAGNVVRVASYPVPDESEETDPLHDPTVNDNVPCCKHYRKAYSHREVHDHAYNNVGGVTGFGVKSFASRDCDGGFIDWFTTNGSVNLGNNHESVYVQGFGLGEMYIAKTPRAEIKEALPKDAYDENDGTLHPWMTWAYGTRFDAKTDTNLPALPRDWPFTNLTATGNKPIFNKLTDTNNITLVKKCSAGVGNLERDIDDETDPQGQRKLHVYNNRHHIVLYPEYSSIQENTEDYEEGTVIVKPLFVHLPATLDTKDGETVDITVSIQNVDQTAFGDPNDPKALSGYHAAMSQPRVYVLGGVQKFSNKKLPVDKDTINIEEDYYTLTTSKPAYDKSGELLPQGTEIRANVIVGTNMFLNTKRSFVLHGTITGNTEEDGMSVRAEGKFPYAKTDRTWDDLEFTICGIAYLDGDDNPTDTPMGLEYRNYDHGSLFAGDKGENDAPLNTYNKFYSRIDGDKDNGKNVFPFMDKRYVLATVYQTATSTFPWAITHRRKLATLTRSWTDELYRDRNSHKALMHMVYEENAKFNKVVRDSLIANDVPEDRRRIMASISPISYMAYQKDPFVWKSLGSVIRVVFASTVLMPAVRDPDGNPVRQARRAVEELASDFYKMRLLSYTPNKRARVKVGNWDINPRTGWTDPLQPTLEPPVYVTDDWTYDLMVSSWCCTLRSLPDYVLSTDSAYVEYATEPESPYSTSIERLFTTPYTATAWYNYLSSDGFPYNKGAEPQEASACTDESGVAPGEPATVTGTPEVYKVYSNNTVLTHYKNRGAFRQYPVLQKLENDLRRYVETVLAIKIPEETYMDLSRVKYVPVGHGDDVVDFVGIKDWMNPFTNIQSVDAVPAPVIDSYDSIDPMPEEFLANDPVALYRKQLTDDSVDTVSTVMPTDSDMAKFLESYVTAYAAEMPKHLYQGSRILCKSGNIPDETSSDDIEKSIYIRAIDRVRKRMFTNAGREEDNDFISHYIDDNFASITSSTRDPNVDRAAVGETSIDVSAPPYSPRELFSNETYTRVIMQFTFSQKAGRWYTTGYRQYPTNYLSPLYGADALGTTWASQFDSNGANSITYANRKFNTDEVTMRPLWRNAACVGFNNYKNHMYTPYSVVPPMDFTLGCVPYLVGDQSAFMLDDTDPEDWNHLLPGEHEGPGRVRREYNGFLDDSTMFMPIAPLEEPYKKVENGGINLYPPSNINGGYEAATEDGIHANFWSVHRFIRPAVSVLPGTKVPSSDPEHPHENGVLSDATLYRMFDFPQAGVLDYRIPSTEDPTDDTANQYLYYHVPGATPEEDLIAGGTGAPGAFILAYGISKEDLNLNGD